MFLAAEDRTMVYLLTVQVLPRHPIITMVPFIKIKRKAQLHITRQVRIVAET